MCEAVIILQTGQGGEQLLSCFGPVPRALRCVAIVAFAARVGRSILIEILQEDFAAARVSIGKISHAAQLVEKKVFLILGFVFKKSREQGKVGTFVKQHSLAFFAIATGSPRFLIIALHVLGQIQVHHKPHIGLVDSHPKGNGGHDDLDVVIFESALPLFAFLSGQSCVVVGRTESIFF